MYSKEGINSLIKEILEKKPFTEMSYKTIFDNIDLVKEKLDELKEEYAYRVHMENGMIEHPDEILHSIKVLKKIYDLLLEYQEEKIRNKSENILKSKKQMKQR